MGGGDEAVAYEIEDCGVEIGCGCLGCIMENGWKNLGNDWDFSLGAV